MRVQRPFAVVSPSVDGAVLSVLARADTWFSIGQVHQLIGDYSEAGVRKAVYRLVGEGIVIERQVGRTHVYELNRSHVAADAVVAIAHSFETLIARMQARLHEFTRPPVYAAIFGSAARRDMSAGSDIDVFLVRPRDIGPKAEQWEHDVSTLSADATAWTGNDVRVLTFAEEEITAETIDAEPVLAAIARDGVTLLGEPGYLHSKGVG